MYPRRHIAVSDRNRCLPKSDKSLGRTQRHLYAKIREPSKSWALGTPSRRNSAFSPDGYPLVQGTSSDISPGPRAGSTAGRRAGPSPPRSSDSSQTRGICVGDHFQPVPFPLSPPHRGSPFTLRFRFTLRTTAVLNDTAGDRSKASGRTGENGAILGPPQPLPANYLLQ